MLTSVELCAGAGGQAIGLEQAGFEHLGLFENDVHACNTLRFNRPAWNVICHDLFQEYDYRKFKNVDLLAGGLPCPPFSVAGKQLGKSDERNLFDIGVNLVDEMRPRAVMFENVKGMMEPKFSDYRDWIDHRLRKLGYAPRWKLLNASDYGVPQLRPRVVMVALSAPFADGFDWPIVSQRKVTVVDAIKPLMASRGWSQVERWATTANRIAPTVVGGSKKHGGPDLGPTRSRMAWKELGIDGIGIANNAPDVDFVGLPKLTVEMVARIQGFPSDWKFTGGKTASYRQVGNAFPPPVAAAVARQIAISLGQSDSQVAVAG